MVAPVFLTSILNWLRAGYPEGIPPGDYVPLMAVLSDGLSPHEVHTVIAELTQTGELTSEALPDEINPIDNIDIGTVVTKITDELPREDDVVRIRARLAAGGWPLADPHNTSR